MRIIVILSVFSAVLIAIAAGHGMMMEPINRSSRWRTNESAPVNWNDNELFCGGAGIQWEVNGGKCGLCGDNYSLSTPRPNEFNGTFGEGVIVGSYKSGDTIPVAVLLTASHLGYFTFDLCNMDVEKETDECFAKHPLKIVGGSNKFRVEDSERGYRNTTLQIPANLNCEHCVLRWTYRTGNSWGTCGVNADGLGCGKQEHFRSCSDIKIAT